MSAIKELDKINIDNNQYELNNKLLGLRSNVKKVLLVQPIQIQEKKLDIRIAKNKRYYMYPPYGLGILNSILKKNKIESKILDLNFEVFNFIRKNKNISNNDLTKVWKEKLKKELNVFNPDLVGVSCTFTMNHENMIEIFKEVKGSDNKILTIAEHLPNPLTVIIDYLHSFYRASV